MASVRVARGPTPSSSGRSPGRPPSAWRVSRSSCRFSRPYSPATARHRRPCAPSTTRPSKHRARPARCSVRSPDRRRQRDHGAPPRRRLRAPVVTIGLVVGRALPRRFWRRWGTRSRCSRRPAGWPGGRRPAASLLWAPAEPVITSVDQFDTLAAPYAELRWSTNSPRTTLGSDGPVPGSVKAFEQIAAKYAGGQH